MKRNPTVQRQREIYDVYDLKLALLDLNRHRFDLEVSAEDAKRLHVICKRIHNRFVVEDVGHKDWPVLSIAPR
jgi:hypothetical protein